MRLHGIELAKPEEWYVARYSYPSRRFREFVLVEGDPVVLDGYPELDCVYTVEQPERVLNLVTGHIRAVPTHRVYLGLDGCMLGSGQSREEAIADATNLIEREHFDKWAQGLIGWLETHPLSPRYRYTGGG